MTRDEAFLLLPGDRVVNREGWHGTVVPAYNRYSELEVAWDDGPHTFDPEQGDRIGSTIWNLLEGKDYVSLEREEVER